MSIKHYCNRSRSTIITSIDRSAPCSQPVLGDLEIGDYCIWGDRLIVRVWCDPDRELQRRRYVNVYNPNATWDLISNRSIMNDHVKLVDTVEIAYTLRN